jgi:hypothetical protein
MSYATPTKDIDQLDCRELTEWSKNSPALESSVGHAKIAALHYDGRALLAAATGPRSDWLQVFGLVGIELAPEARTVLQVGLRSYLQQQQKEIDERKRVLLTQDKRVTGRSVCRWTLFSSID